LPDDLRAGSDGDDFPLLKGLDHLELFRPSERGQKHLFAEKRASDGPGTNLLTRTHPHAEMAIWRRQRLHAILS
jgi:hypothetical protein